MSNKLNVIVTGASGFIGKQVTKSLLMDGFRVYAITRHTSQPYELPDLVWTSWESYLEVISPDHEVFAVVNLATTYGNGNESWSEILKCNVTQPLEIFRYAMRLGAKKIISADSFFGKSKYDYQHLLSYINSKNKLVDSTKKLISNKDVTFINLRLEHVFGANDGPNKFVTKLIKDFQSEKNKIALTDGMQKRDFIYIYDVVGAFMSVMKHVFPAGFTEYEVGTGNSIELKLFCLALADAFRVSADTLYFGALDHRPNEIMDSSADTESLISIGWTPTWDLGSAMYDLAQKQKSIDL
jgi:CDP-abequose synthase